MKLNDSLVLGHDPEQTLLLSPATARVPATRDTLPEGVEHGGEGLNPLVRAANPLLDVVVPLRGMARPPDREALRERLVRAVRQFEKQALASRVPTQAIAVARYALCTLVDETISSTPWGAGVWSSRSLLVTFHNEAGGGEKFFQVLQRLTLDPRGNLDLLELMYLCLALGLEGRYRVVERGSEQLEALRERLFELIRQQRGSVEADLSPRWRGVLQTPTPMRGLSLWGTVGLAIALLAGLQLGCNWLLGRATAPVLAQMAEMRLAPSLQAPARPAPVSVAGLLAEDIAEGLVSVQESADRALITLPGQGLFASGSAEVSGSQRALLGRIGDALSQLPGEVLVVGHTDNQPPAAGARLASNSALSQARAASVARLLGLRAGPAARYRSEGRGESEPLVANDSSANRARNRRVEITVFFRRSRSEG
ncbi:type IVB secretion system protein IcmH/DotU [Pseudomonas sp. NPDC089401]|uniref:type IVB secretion system protein IcmH/DotU n=1 Tax=Pseudomonas sp. NPDC089401 TaxID=3364462 RepID=UPI0038156629